MVFGQDFRHEIEINRPRRQNNQESNKTARILHVVERSYNFERGKQDYEVESTSCVQYEVL